MRACSELVQERFVPGICMENGEVLLLLVLLLLGVSAQKKGDEKSEGCCLVHLVFVYGSRAYG